MDFPASCFPVRPKEPIFHPFGITRNSLHHPVGGFRPRVVPTSRFTSVGSRRQPRRNGGTSRPRNELPAFLGDPTRASETLGCRWTVVNHPFGKTQWGASVFCHMTITSTYYKNMPPQIRETRLHFLIYIYRVPEIGGVQNRVTWEELQNKKSPRKFLYKIPYYAKPPDRRVFLHPYKNLNWNTDSSSD